MIPAMSPDRLPAPPAHHTGPGFATTPPPRDLAFDDDLSELVVRLLNYVPEEHRTLDATGDARVEEQIESHVQSCHKHPFRALWVAHRHLESPDAEVRLRALLLASEALWWLGHLDDAHLAAQTVLNAHPDSAQARWRLAVTLYRQARIEDAKRELDLLLEQVNRYAPAWALRAQTKIWLTPDHPHSADADFSAAAELDPAMWVVPVRLDETQFHHLLRQETTSFLEDTDGEMALPEIEVELLPSRTSVAHGKDPDIRGAYFNPADPTPTNPLAYLGGDFAAGGRTAIIPGARLVFYQRNIENLCATEEMLHTEVTKSIAEAYDGMLRLGASVIDGAPEHHAEDATAPPAGIE